MDSSIFLLRHKSFRRSKTTSLAATIWSLVSVDTERLGDTLRWEVSRGGALFPHIYGDLPLTSVLKAVPLELKKDGTHVFPKGF